MTQQVEIRSIQSHEIDAFISHCVSVFGDRNPRSYFESHLYDDPKALAEMSNIIVGIDHGIAAALRIVPRLLYCNQHIVSVAGIAEVSTREDWRRKGLASQLLSRLGDFYERRNWRSIAFEHVIMQSEYDVSDCQIKTLKLADKGMAAAALRLYEQYSSRFNGPVVRDLEYMQNWVVARHRRLNVSSLAIFTNEGSLNAYVFGRVVNSMIDIEELIVGNGVSLSNICSLLNNIDPKANRFRMPKIVAANLGLLTDSMEAERDLGWMYMEASSMKDGLENVSQMIGEQFLFWATDAF